LAVRHGRENASYPFCVHHRSDAAEVLTLILVLSCPKGYPRLAAVLDSDENFMLYRRFGFLQARLLLHKQDELAELEDELDELDQADALERPLLLQCRRNDDEKVGERKKLLQKIDLKFKEYGAVFLESNPYAHQR
jgi:hypothetical protein